MAIHKPSKNFKDLDFINEDLLKKDSWRIIPDN